MGFEPTFSTPTTGNGLEDRSGYWPKVIDVHCLNCEVDIKRERTGTRDGKPIFRKFCSKSCSATYNNTCNPKRKLEGSCELCQAKITATRKVCNSCRGRLGGNVTSILQKKRNEAFIQDWLAGKVRGGTDYGLSIIIRRYLIDQAHQACIKCRWSVPHPDSGEIPLEINHKDGDGLNHAPDNLEVLCANCHSLTSSYRGRNAGNGRPWSYHRKLRTA